MHLLADSSSAHRPAQLAHSPLKPPTRKEPFSWEVTEAEPQSWDACQGAWLPSDGVSLARKHLDDIQEQERRL